MLTSKSKTNSSFPSIKIELGNEVFFPFIDAANDIFKHFNNQTGQGIDSFGYLIVFPFLFRSNDQTSDNGIKHTLTLLAMTGNVDDALSFIVIGNSLQPSSILPRCRLFFSLLYLFNLHNDQDDDDDDDVTRCIADGLVTYSFARDNIA